MRVEVGELHRVCTSNDAHSMHVERYKRDRTPGNGVTPHMQPSHPSQNASTKLRRKQAPSAEPMDIQSSKHVHPTVCHTANPQESEDLQLSLVSSEAHTPSMRRKHSRKAPHTALTDEKHGCISAGICPPPRRPLLGSNGSATATDGGTQENKPEDRLDSKPQRSQSTHRAKRAARKGAEDTNDELVDFLQETGSILALAAKLDSVYEG
jgi:hypothetical protein